MVTLHTTHRTTPMRPLFFAFKAQLAATAASDHIMNRIAAFAGGGSAFHVDVGYLVWCKRSARNGAPCRYCTADNPGPLTPPYHVIVYQIGNYGGDSGVFKVVDRWTYTEKNWRIYSLCVYDAGVIQATTMFMNDQVGKSFASRWAWVWFLLKPITSFIPIGSSRNSDALEQFADDQSWSCSKFATVILNFVSPAFYDRAQLAPDTTTPAQLEAAILANHDLFKRIEFQQPRSGIAHAAGPMVQRMLQ